MPIAVTGATGAVGSRVAAGLAAAGQPQVLVVRDAARAPQHPGAEVRTAAGYHAREELEAAFAGCGTALIIPAAEAPDRVDQHRTAVDAALAAGVGRIVYLSFLNATADATFLLARDHWHTEEHVRASGARWTFPRMSLYADFLPLLATDGVIRGPAGEGRFAPVARADVADACVATLLADDLDGRTIDLTGPELLSVAEAAALVDARYEEETVEEAFASRAGQAPDWEVAGWVSTYTAIADGSLAVVSDGVRELTGREPIAPAALLAG